MTKSGTKRLAAVMMAVIYSGFLTMVLSCPMGWQTHCCPAKKAQPSCPMGKCLTDGATSSSQERAKPAAAIAMPGPLRVLASFEWRARSTGAFLLEGHRRLWTGVLRI